MDELRTVYRRPLPGDLIPFSSEAGRRMFRESLESGHLEVFFPLIEQFHTQSDPAFCGLGSLVMVLNALGVDPGRVWRGPWRWFSEELLDCCTPLARVQTTGLTLEEVACVARCNGARVELGSVAPHGEAKLREQVEAATRGGQRMLIASYQRRALGQTGEGHFSPIGAYHPASDRVLVLDVARFKYPPHWVPLPELYGAMREADPVTGRPRGWLLLEKRAGASAIAQFILCSEGLGTRAVLERALALQREALSARRPRTLEDVLALSAEALSASGLLEQVRLRVPDTAEHRQAFEELSALLTSLPLYSRAAGRLEPFLAGRVLVWWLAAPDAALGELPEVLRAELTTLLDIATLPATLATEIELLRSQVAFLLEQPLLPSPAPADDALLEARAAPVLGGRTEADAAPACCRAGGGSLPA